MSTTRDVQSAAGRSASIWHTISGYVIRHNISGGVRSAHALYGSPPSSMGRTTLNVFITFVNAGGAHSMSISVPMGWSGMVTGNILTSERRLPSPCGWP